MTPRLRLLKVIVQPVFVVDDGENITEQIAQPFTVPAADWRSFADVDGQFDQAVAGLAEQTEGAVPMNRAARRKAAES